MKRLISSLLIAFLIIGTLGSASYQPSVSVTTGTRGAHIADDFLRTSTLMTLSAVLPTVTFSSTRLSLPIGATISSSTRVHDGISLHGYLDAFAGLSLEQRFTGLFSMEICSKLLYRYYHEIDSSLFGLGAEIGIYLSPTEAISIFMPFEIDFLKGEYDYTFSIGSRFRLGGGR